MILKKKLFNLLFRKKKLRFKRLLQGMSYGETRSVLIVAEYSKAEDLDNIYRIGTRLTFDNKDFLMFLWSEQKKEKIPFPDSQHYLLIGPDDFTFLKTPKKGNRFCSLLSKPYDLFMDLTRNAELPLLWIAEFNRAKIKIGFEKFSEPVFDVNIKDTYSSDLTSEEIFRIFVQYLNWFKVQKQP